MYELHITIDGQPARGGRPTYWADDPEVEPRSEHSRYSAYAWAVKIAEAISDLLPADKPRWTDTYWLYDIRAIDMHLDREGRWPDSATLIMMLADGRELHAKVTRWDGERLPINFGLYEYRSRNLALEHLKELAIERGINPMTIDWGRAAVIEIGNPGDPSWFVVQPEVRGNLGSLNELLDQYRWPEMAPVELSARRAALGLSQSQLAERLGISQAHVSQMERGGRRIPTGLAGELLALEDAVSDFAGPMMHAVLEDDAQTIEVGNDPLERAAAVSVISKARQMGKTVRLMAKP